MIMKKSQTAIEFLILTGVMLFFFTSFFLIIGENTEDKAKENINRIITDIATSVQDEINFAFESMEGYNREFKIPEDINGLEYDISLIEGQVYLKTDNGKYAISLPVQNVIGDISKGENVIKKQGGVIYLNV